MMTVKPPRQKKTPACKQCRQRKIGCDRMRPYCGNCIKRGLSSCEYPERKGGSHSDRSNNTGVTITGPTDVMRPPPQTFQPVPSHPPTQSTRPIMETGASGAMKYKTFADMPMSVNVNKLPISTGSNNINFPIKQINTQTRNGPPAVSMAMGTQISNQDLYIPKYVKPNSAANIREREDYSELNEVMFNTRMNSVEVNDVNGDGKSVNTRVQLLNENLNSVPHLFNPTDVAAIYAKQNNTSNHHKGKKNKKQGDANNIVLNQPAPVFYDLMTSVYSQEEILLKEMEFLKDRYLELSHYQSKLSANQEEEPSKQDEHDHTFKKRKITEDTTEDTAKPSTENTPVKKPEEITIPFLLLNSIDEMAMANETQLSKLPHTLQNYLNVTPLNLTLNNLIQEDPNSIFNKNFVVLRDSYLIDFYQYLINIVKQSFEPNLKQHIIAKSKLNVSDLNVTSNLNIKNVGDGDVFLKPDLIIEILKCCAIELPQLNQIFYPILDFNLDVWTKKINHIFKDSTKLFDFIVLEGNETTALSNLSFVGVVIMMMLFYYYSSDDKKVAKEEPTSRTYHEKLREYILHKKPFFIRELSMIKEKLIHKTSTFDNEETTKDVLRFLILFETFQQIIYDYPYNLTPLDLNEDIVLALERSVNNSNTIKDKDLKLYWKVISNNYLKKKLFEGKVPLLLVNQLPIDYFTEKNGNKCIGDNPHRQESAEINKHNFFVSQLKIINYLNGKKDEANKVKTINEIAKLVTDMDNKYFAFMKQTPLPDHSPSNDIINSYHFKGVKKIEFSLQYYKIKLYLEYLTFLQWENYKDANKITPQFTKLFERAIIPSLLLIFQTTQGEENEYHFLVIKKALSLLEDLLDILFAVYKRFQNYLYCQKNKRNNGNITQEDKDINEALSTFTRTFELLFIAINAHLSDCSGWTPFASRSYSLHCTQKVSTMLYKIGHDMNVSSKLFDSQMVTRDPVTGMLSYENTIYEDTYSKITRQELVTFTQGRNNGLRNITDLSTLGRYVKDIKVLLLKLIHIMGRNSIKSFSDLDIWFAMQIKVFNPDLPSCDMTSETFADRFDAFFY